MGAHVVCCQSIQVSAVARTRGSAGKSEPWPYFSQRYRVMAFDSQSTKSSSTRVGTSPVGFIAR